MTTDLVSWFVRPIIAGLAQAWLEGKFGADPNLDFVDAKSEEAIKAVAPLAMIVSTDVADQFVAILKNSAIHEVDVVLRENSLQPAVHAAVLILRGASTNQVLRFLQPRWPGQYVTGTVRHYLNRLVSQGHIYKQMVGDRAFYTAEDNDDLKEKGNGSD